MGKIREKSSLLKEWGKRKDRGGRGRKRDREKALEKNTWKVIRSQQILQRLIFLHLTETKSTLNWCFINYHSFNFINIDKTKVTYTDQKNVPALTPCLVAVIHS
jgi:hypothetical protein